MPDLSQQRRAARELYATGKIGQAVAEQRLIIEQQTRASGEVLVSDYRQLVFFLIAAKQTAEASQILGPVVRACPDNADLMSILGLVYTNLKEHDKAIGYLKKALAVDQNCFMAADQLTRCYLAKGDLSKAKYHGEYALNTKDSLFGAGEIGPDTLALLSSPPEKFRPNKKKANVISFSLWGDNERYISGALRNCELAGELYPHWQCRFYVDDSVPSQVIKNLGGLGGDVRMMPAPERIYDGLFWRFRVVSDPHISRYLIRDCDAVINVKERVAVDEWLASDKHFHVMRDYYTHTDLVLAGMWGGVTGVIDDVEEVIRDYTESHIQSRVMDQTFLNERLWPTMRRSCLMHDSCFDTRYSQAYPPYCDLPPGRHIGQDETAYKHAQRVGSRAE